MNTFRTIIIHCYKVNKHKKQDKEQKYILEIFFKNKQIKKSKVKAKKPIKKKRVSFPFYIFSLSISNQNLLLS